MAETLPDSGVDHPIDGYGRGIADLHPIDVGQGDRGRYLTVAGTNHRDSRTSRGRTDGQPDLGHGAGNRAGEGCLRGVLLGHGDVRVGGIKLRLIRRQLSCGDDPAGSSAGSADS